MPDIFIFTFFKLLFGIMYTVKRFNQVLGTRKNKMLGCTHCKYLKTIAQSL